MGLQSQIKLPVIDFSQENLKPGTSTWVATCNKVRQALEEHSCFEAKFDKVPLQLHETVFSAVGELFDLPTEVKLRNKSNKPYFGYFGQFKSLPLYESMAIDNPTALEGAQSFTNLMWPAGNDRFRESTQSFSELVAELDRMVMRMLFESYGVGNYYDYYVKSSNYLLRLFKYRKPEMGEAKNGLYPHIDKTILSIIHQGHVSGLLVKVKDDQWVTPQPSPTSFVVMAGEALTAWSNDRIPPCYHQVIMTEKERRISIGTFSFINGIIHILEELGDENHPIKYKSFNHFEFLHFVKSHEGKNWNAIKAFCGV
ncbi:Oxoglutarate/iron-dependent dioxygenase [Corchorus olitorius]|uniref:Oxoglutarate/iron-dependent dioxygenase n=1 Tax=Corchorus olitorius TaxID=93759 RepID=A0A1R3JZD2_9ROSI|nr:Oxoglutarate/iron-dependent dioxygenase [Corchorus olitorius]